MRQRRDKPVSFPALGTPGAGGRSWLSGVPAAAWYPHSPAGRCAAPGQLDALIWRRIHHWPAKASVASGRQAGAGGLRLSWRGEDTNRLFRAGCAKSHGEIQRVGSLPQRCSVDLGDHLALPDDLILADEQAYSS